MSPPMSSAPPYSMVFIFEKGPTFRAIEGGKEQLAITPRSSKLLYSIVFALYGLPAKIIYKGPGRRPEDVGRLEYFPTHRDLMFIRAVKRILSIFHKDPEAGKRKLKKLLMNFYEDKLSTLSEWVPDLFPSEDETFQEYEAVPDLNGSYEVLYITVLPDGKTKIDVVHEGEAPLISFEVHNNITEVVA